MLNKVCFDMRILYCHCHVYLFEFDWQYKKGKSSSYFKNYVLGHSNVQINLFD